MRKKYFCIFCEARIFPELDGTGDSLPYINIFQCLECGALYESIGRIPADVKIIHQRTELNFEENFEEN